MAGQSKQWNKVGSLRKSKNGALYIKVESEITLTKDANLSLQDPRKKLQEAAANGRISKEQADERINKIPEFIKYDVFLMPTEGKG